MVNKPRGENLSGLMSAERRLNRAEEGNIRSIDSNDLSINRHDLCMNSPQGVFSMHGQK